jgi:tRNA (cytidine/uridine-2'-O-)-methyltransferase
MRAAQPAEARFFFLTTKAKRAYWDVEFRDGDILVFGRESKGLPEPLLAANSEQCFTIPMQQNSARSLNLSTAAGIVVYEAVRQLNRGITGPTLNPPV